MILATTTRVLRYLFAKHIYKKLCQFTIINERIERIEQQKNDDTILANAAKSTIKHLARRQIKHHNCHSRLYIDESATTKSYRKEIQLNETKDEASVGDGDVGINAFVICKW